MSTERETISIEAMRCGFAVKAHTALLSQPRGVAAGRGATVSEDGRAILAITSGLAMVDSEKVVVHPAHVHWGDLRRDTPLSVSGSVVITGGLGPGCWVKATGFVVVMDEVDHARIEALGPVLLRKGCRESVVQVGTSGHIYQHSIDRLVALEAALSRLKAVIAQLNAMPSFRTLDLQTSLEPLMQVLVEHSFAGFPSQVSQVIKRCAALEHLSPAIEELRQYLEVRFSLNRLLYITLSDIHEAHRLVRSALQVLTAVRDIRQDLTVDYGARDSILQASGAVRIVHGDCKQCNVSAGTAVHVDGEISGGTATAGDRIEALSASGGASLEVNSFGKIHVGVIEEGTQLRVAHLTTRLRSSLFRSMVHVSDGNLKFGSSAGR